MRLKNSDRMVSEFFQLHPKLQLIICDVDLWGIQHGEEPTWTCFLRTQEEQLALIASGEADPKDKLSVHMFGRGADFRLFKNPNLDLLIGDYLNEKYPYGDLVHKTHLQHRGTGMGEHHHVQVKEDL